MLSCPRCGGDLPEGAERCEHCGHRVADTSATHAADAKPPPRWTAGLGCGLIGVLLVLISVVLVFGLLLGGLLGAVAAGP